MTTKKHPRDDIAMLTAAIQEGLAWRTANPSKYTSDGRLKSEAVQAREAAVAKLALGRMNQQNSNE